MEGEVLIGQGGTNYVLLSQRAVWDSGSYMSLTLLF